MLNQKPSILIADDDPNICQIFKLIISPDEYDILTAENGVDAYEKTSKFQPALVFSDILMPKCNGFELCTKIKTNAATKHIPFIFLTGLDKTQFKNRLDEVNADDFLVKPFSSQDMKEKINAWIKKPVIHCNTDLTPMIQSPKKNEGFYLGIDAIDDQLHGPLPPETFLLLSGPIGSGKTSITRAFIQDGIQREQTCMMLSFKPLHQKTDPLFNLNDHQKQRLTICDASRWSSVDSPPWRNIDYIFDYLHAQCETRPFNRIAFDSFSHGFAFWPIKPLLQFFDLCRTLPNANKQCMLWSINTHPEISALHYHLNHVTDIGIEIDPSVNRGKPTVVFSNWQAPNAKHMPLMPTH